MHSMIKVGAVTGAAFTSPIFMHIYKNLVKYALSEYADSKFMDVIIAVNVTYINRDSSLLSFNAQRSDNRGQ